MASQTTVLDESFECFNSDTGEISRQHKHKVVKSKIEPTDEYFKVSRYLNTIFAYNNIPISLVPISLLIAQRMAWKTNVVYLLKEDKEEMALMLGITLDRVNHLIRDLKKYDILRASGTKGKYGVNGYLFSTGNVADTRNIQAQFDFESGEYIVQADMKHQITGEKIRKIVHNKPNGLKQIPGQLSLFDGDGGDE